MDFKLAYSIMHFLNDNKKAYDPELYEGSLLAQVIDKNAISHQDFWILAGYYVHMYRVLCHYEAIAEKPRDPTEESIYVDMHSCRKVFAGSGSINLDSLAVYKDYFLEVLRRHNAYTGWNDSVLINPREEVYLSKTDNPVYDSGGYRNVKFDGLHYYPDNSERRDYDRIGVCRWWKYNRIESIFEGKELELQCQSST